MKSLISILFIFLANAPTKEIPVASLDNHKTAAPIVFIAGFDEDDNTFYDKEFLH